MDLLLIIIVLAIVVVVVAAVSTRNNKTGQGAADQGAGTQPVGQRAQQIAQDIRATKTSRVVDEVDVLRELDATSPGFRQYCELVGTSMPDSNVTAPYSQRKVAYYDVRCYRIENINGCDTETLVARENSIEPFWFKDASCDVPVYIDLKTFGGNIVLVNSSNHVEGPTSDFARAYSSHTKAGGQAGAYAFAAQAVRRAENLLVWPAWAAKRATFGVCRAARSATAALVRPVSFGMVPALAGAGANGSFAGGMERREWLFMGGPGGPGFGGPGFGGPGFGGPGGPGGPGFGGPGMGGMPAGLGSFLGGMPQQGYPMGNPRRDNDAADVLVGMGLGALLGSLAANSGQAQQQTTAPQSQFRGYRLVEDVVPLNSPIYCIGEIYLSGDEVHMGRSVAKDYPTSYFACKHEAELLSSLGA